MSGCPFSRKVFLLGDLPLLQAEQEVRSECLREGQTIGPSALLPEDDLREFLPEPIRLVRIGRLLEPTRES